MKAIQYTLRDIPPEVDAYMRREARRIGVSLNKLSVDYLSFVAKEHIKDEKLVADLNQPSHWLDNFLDSLDGKPAVDAKTVAIIEQQARLDRQRMKRKQV